MVSIKEKDRNMLHFLWFDNPEQDRPRIAQFRFNRLLFGLRPSPSILGATITVTAVMRDVTHSLARSREALRVKKYMCSIEVENRFNARLTSSFIL